MPRDGGRRGRCRALGGVPPGGDPPDASRPIRVVTGVGWLSHGYWNVAVPLDLRHLTAGANKTGSTDW
jgi:hypothetical protein